MFGHRRNIWTFPGSSVQNLFTDSGNIVTHLSRRRSTIMLKCPRIKLAPPLFLNTNTNITIRTISRFLFLRHTSPPITPKNFCLELNICMLKSSQNSVTTVMPTWISVIKQLTGMKCMQKWRGRPHLILRVLRNWTAWVSNFLYCLHVKHTQLVRNRLI